MEDIGTWELVQGKDAGDLVDLLVRVTAVQEKHTAQKEEPFLEVNGVDVNGTRVDTIGMWRWEEGDVRVGAIYILRGLKISPATYWCSDAWKYVPRENGSKTVEISARTAAEEVTEVAAFNQYFRAV